VIDLEHAEPLALAQREGVEARAQDDVLREAACGTALDLVFRIAQAGDAAREDRARIEVGRRAQAGPERTASRACGTSSSTAQ
jgi:hypothetical protein